MPYQRGKNPAPGPSGVRYSQPIACCDDERAERGEREARDDVAVAQPATIIAR